MAYPWIVENNWETGLHGADASSGALIDFPHYTTLARYGMAPYRGAYCLRVILAGGTTSQYVRENGVNIAAAAVNYVRWYFYLGKDLVMANADKLTMVELESTEDTTAEATAGIQRTGDNIEFWYNETQAAAGAAAIVLGTTTTALGRWHHAELEVTVDSGAPNDGTIIGYIDDAAGATISSLDQLAVVDARIGTLGVDAGTSGTILIDNFIHDDGRIYRYKHRFPGTNIHVTHSEDHPIIGPARFSAAVTGTGTNAVLSLYDSDGVPTNLEPFAVIRNLTANEFVPGHDIFEVVSGLYTIMSGTAAQAFISVEKGGVLSDGHYTSRGLRQARVPPGP